MRICTNPHQGRLLLSMGLESRSADLWWSQYVPDGGSMGLTEDPVLYSYKVSLNDIPAWSLTTLFQALPDAIIYKDEDYSLYLTKTQNIYVVGYKNDQGVLMYRDGMNLIDICVQIIVHLVKNQIPLNSAYKYDNI